MSDAKNTEKIHKINHIVDVDCRVIGAKIYSDAKYDYSCSLTYTDIGMNSNKFYVMQIIHANIAIDSCHFALYTKYGRTGEKGVPYTKWMASAQLAIKAFVSQYKSKTGNVWGSDFEPKPNKYYDLKVDNFEVEEEENTTQSSSTNIGSNNDNTYLENEVTNLIKLISDTNIHLEAIRSFGVDTKKMPLGKISNSVINEANSILYALSEIVNAIDDGTWEKSRQQLGLDESFTNDLICSLSNTFWTRVPYACGRGNPPPMIDSLYQIDRCAELLDLMKNSKIAGQIIKRNKGIFDIYKSLNTDIKVCANSDEIDFVTNFVIRTKAPTHNYNLKVLEIFSVTKDIEDVNGLFHKTSNHTLLAHGSRMSNFMGILSTGLRVPSNTQIANGSILGRGIYFADVISKSFNYCNARDTNDVGFILLCEVALGDKYDDHETVVPHDKLNLPKGCTCRRGLGQTDVTNNLYYEYENEDKSQTAQTTQTTQTTVVKIPQGGLSGREGMSTSASFLYNEYVIFDARQYRFKYLVKVASI